MRGISVVLLAVLMALASPGYAEQVPPSAPASGSSEGVAPPVPGQAAAADDRADLTVTIIGAVGVAALAVAVGPYVLPLLEVGSVSVLCVVAPVCY